MNQPRQPGPDVDAFEAILEAKGIELSPDERASVRELADWLASGVRRLSAVGEPAPAEVPSAVPDALDVEIPELARRLRDGRLTSLALTRACLDRIRERDPRYRAFYTVLADRALADARRADDELRNGIDRGPLHGIPVAIKDMIDVEGVPTTAGSRSRSKAVAAANAEVVQRLADGGAVIVGKLATYEWATVGPAFDTLFPPARNPWNLAHITGGSSSGPAAAVAGGLLRTSLGTDTGGSVRSPACYCGVVGLKPTFDLISTGGVVALAPSLDHVGVISASVAEAALTLDVVSGCVDAPDAAASRLGKPLDGLRIGYARNFFAGDPQATPAVVEAIDAAVSQLSLLGAVIEPVDLPDYQLFEAAGAAILHAEAFELHRSDLAAHPEAYGRKSFQTLAAGMLLSEGDLAEARRAGLALRARLDADVLSRFDAFVTACTLTAALPFAAFDKSAVWTPMRTIGFNVTGHPVLALPTGLDHELPIGMQIVGRHFDEATICQIGDAWERSGAYVPLQAPYPPPEVSPEVGALA